jgi:tetratricopeptide (TPR) repeat protein
MKGKLHVIALVALLFAGSTAEIARADAAPPGKPPGSNLVSEANTQVRMLAETVIITVLSSAPEGSYGQAQVDASFTFRNMGDSQEQMDVGFPLAWGSGYLWYPEISNVQVTVGGYAVSVRREMAPNEFDYYSTDTDTPIPWAIFAVTFPSGQDVRIKISYVLEATPASYSGDPPIKFDYIFETGAGWYDTIGSADIIFRTPVELDDRNLIGWRFNGYDPEGYNPETSTRELRWHRENFEPTEDDSFSVEIVKPLLWQQVLIWDEYVRLHPEEGEYWGLLGKAYKDVICYERFCRSDPAAVEMYQLSVEAYEKAITMKPHDALWHCGFADLLWRNFTGGFGEGDPDEALRAVAEVHTALSIDPDLPEALELADWMHNWHPELVGWNNRNQFVFLALTATPTPKPPPTPGPSSTPIKPTATRTRVQLPPTYTHAPTLAATTTEELPAQSPTATEASPAQLSKPVSAAGPLVGGIAIVLLAMIVAFWLYRRKR